MKYNILYLFVFVGSTCMLSCTSDWLKPEPLSFYAPENLLVDKNGYEAM